MNVCLRRPADAGRDSAQILVPDRIRVDVAIIGSGPGGSVTGAMLARAGRDVAIFEEGAWVRPEDTIPFSPDEMSRKLRNNGQTMALGKAMVAFWEGRCLGGGSEVNRGLYHRPSPEVVAAWAAQGAVDALSPEDLTARAGVCEGTARISLLPGPAPRVSQKLAEGAAALGWHHMEVPRLFVYDDDWQASPQTGRKQSMSNTFIPDFVAAGGRLYTGTRVRRIARQDGGWRLQASANGPDGRPRPVEIRARKVFVACGATQTPALLRRSGITRRVGDSLRFHTMIKAVARFAEPLADDNPLDPVHQVKEFDPRFSLGASVSTAATVTFGLSDRIDILPHVRDDWRHLGVYYAQTTGGCGTVRVLPGFDDPLIRSETRANDLADLAAGLRSLCESLFAAGAIEVYPNLRGGPTLRSPDDLDLLPDILAPDRLSLSTLHLLASCPMGSDPRRSVTDSFGRVHDAEDLYLADSAMLPGPTVVNPQGTIMAMAHRNAEHFLEATVR